MATDAEALSPPETGELSTSPDSGEPAAESAVTEAPPPRQASVNAGSGVDPVGEYLDAIEKAETQGGAWSTDLIDLYYGMGKALMDNGELDQARDAFHRAAMVARVNNGPYSLEQSDYLYGIAEIEFRVGNPEAATEALETIYRINAREYGEENPDLLPAVEKIYTWYADHLASDGLPIRSADFQNLALLMERIALLTEAKYGLGNLRTALSYRALGQAHYRAIHFMVSSGQAPQSDLVLETGEDSGPVAPDRVLVDHLMRGEQALRHSVESWQANPDATALEVAEALAQLGDWNLALDFGRAARQTYEQAWQVLSASDAVGFLAPEYLGTPTPLRFMNPARDFVRNLDSPPDASSLQVSMTVTDDGRVRDVEVVNVPSSVPDEQLEQLKQELKLARFRPAVLEGEVQPVEGYVWKTALAPE